MKLILWGVGGGGVILGGYHYKGSRDGGRLMGGIVG